MATLEQIAGKGRKFKTQSGAEYQFPPRSLAIRMQCIEFAEKAQKLQEAAAGMTETEAALELCNLMLDVLEGWLKRGYPDITRERIAEDFDLGDIPGLMLVINSFEAEVQTLLPPASNRAQRRARSRK